MAGEPAAIAGAAGAATSNATAQTGGWWDRITGFFSSFTEEGGIGKVLGGLLGLAGAWFAGNFFGGGIMSTILTIALAVPLMLIGSDSIGGWINGMFGQPNGNRAAPQTGPSQAVAGPAQTQQQTPAQAQSQTQTTAAPATASLTLSNDELNAILARPNSDHQRISLYVDPADTAHRLHVREVAANEATAPGILSVEQVRAMAQSTTSGQVAGVVFTTTANGSASVSAIPARPAGNPVATPSR